MILYNKEGDSFIESQQGILPGIEWQDSNNNQFRAIMHTPDFAGLSNRQLAYVYRVQVKLNGTDEWLDRPKNGDRDRYVLISDNNFIDVVNGGLVDRTEAYQTIERLDGSTYEQLKSGYAPQFTYFIQNIGIGMHGEIKPLYYLMINQIKNIEGITAQ